MSAALQQNPYLDELAFSGEKVRLGENFRLGVCVGEKLAANDCCIREKVRLTERCTSDREYYNYFRYYDPSTGRYITSDPIGLEGGLNTYAYANGNPLMFIDPLGLMAWTLPGRGAATIPGFPSSPNSDQSNHSESGGDAGNNSTDRGRPDRSRPQRCEDDNKKPKCYFEREVYYGGPEKTCIYRQKGSFGMFTIRQYANKPCPPIDPETCWVDTTGTPEEGKKPPVSPYKD